MNGYRYIIRDENGRYVTTVEAWDVQDAQMLARRYGQYCYAEREA
jgi:hypothetical protein